MQEIRPGRTETRTWEGCQEFHEQPGCVWELDQWKVWMSVRFLSVAESFFFPESYSLVMVTSEDGSLHNVLGRHYRVPQSFYTLHDIVQIILVRLASFPTKQHSWNSQPGARGVQGIGATVFTNKLDAANQPRGATHNCTPNCTWAKQSHQSIYIITFLQMLRRIFL